MTNFVDSNSFEVHDDYYTPKSTWELIVPYIENVNYHLSEYPKIWEMCLLNSNEQSKEYLDELLPNVIIGDKNCNCLLPNDYEDECDMIITNPPFDTEIKKHILQKLVQLDKPFIIKSMISSTLLGSNIAFSKPIISGILVEFEPRTTAPQDIASRGGKPKPSCNEGKINNLQFLYKLASSSSET